MGLTAALFALVAFFAFVIEATVGFGATVFMVTAAALFAPIDLILPVFVPVNLGLSAYLTLRYRRQIDAKLLFVRVVPFMAAGIPVGLLLFNLENEAWLKRAFGAFVVLLAAVELVALHLERRRIRADGTGEIGRNSRPLPFPAEAGLLGSAGVIHGIYGSGGPMVVYVLSRRLETKGPFRATLAALWLMANTGLVVNYALTSRLSAETGAISVVLVAPLLLGLAVGEWVHRRIDVVTFRVGVFAVLLAGGTLLVLRG